LNLKLDESPVVGPTLLTIPQVATALSLGRSTVYELVQRSQLPVVRIGRAVRIHVRDLELFAEQLRQDAGASVGI
jgi:excisionase family DNA binding protein